MRTRRSRLPELNTGSMADIAFLLLIFFLVTATIPNDEGINRKLPRECPSGQICDIDINERNLLRILLNSKDEIFINEVLVSMSDVKETVTKFVDNNGDTTCYYCGGKNVSTSSDNPNEAVISIEADSQSSYKQFVTIQDELTKAYFKLRKKYARTVFNKYIDELTKEEMLQTKKAYPFMISEAITKPIN